MTQEQNIACYSIDYVTNPGIYSAYTAVTEYTTIQALSDICALFMRFKRDVKYAHLLHYDDFDVAVQAELPSFGALCFQKVKVPQIQINIMLLFDVFRYCQGHPTSVFLINHENAIKELGSTRW